MDEVFTCAAYTAAGVLAGFGIIALLLFWGYKADNTHNGPADKNWDFRRRIR